MGRCAPDTRRTADYKRCHVCESSLNLDGGAMLIAHVMSELRSIVFFSVFYQWKIKMVFIIFDSWLHKIITQARSFRTSC